MNNPGWGLGPEPKPKHPSWCGGVRVCSHVLSPIEFGVPGTQPGTLWVRLVTLAVQEFRIGGNCREPLTEGRTSPVPVSTRIIKMGSPVIPVS